MALFLHYLLPGPHNTHGFVIHPSFKVRRQELEHNFTNVIQLPSICRTVSATTPSKQSKSFRSCQTLNNIITTWDIKEKP